jgi:hypothetical protein
MKTGFFPVWKYYTGKSLFWPCTGPVRYCSEPKKVLNERDVKEIRIQLHVSLSESARILVKDHECPIEFIETLARLSIK